MPTSTSRPDTLTPAPAPTKPSRSTPRPRPKARRRQRKRRSSVCSRGQVAVIGYCAVVPTLSPKSGDKGGAPARICSNQIGEQRHSPCVSLAPSPAKCDTMKPWSHCLARDVPHGSRYEGILHLRLRPSGEPDHHLAVRGSRQAGEVEKEW